MIDLNTILSGVLSDLEIAIEKSEATIEVGDLPTIEADETQMRQLFQNLISNAMKFRKENENPYIEIKSEFHQKTAHLISTPGDTFVKIFVKDNGIGFDTKYKEKVFSNFSKIRRTKV